MDEEELNYEHEESRECKEHLRPNCNDCFHEIGDCISKQKVVEVLFKHDTDISWTLIKELGVLKEYKERMKKDQEEWEDDRQKKLENSRGRDKGKED